MHRPAWLVLGLALSGCGKATSQAKPGPWSRVSVGRDHACALAKNGRARCWGVTTQVHAPYQTLVAGWNDDVCGLLENGGARCISSNTGELVRGLEGDFVSITVGADKLCGLTPEGGAVCTGVASSLGPYLAIDAGPGSVCGVRSDGSVVCWSGEPPESAAFAAAGLPGQSQYTVPYGEYPGAFVQVAVGWQHLCARSATGQVQCWGGLAAQSPTGSFLDIQSSENACCGLKVDGSVACWGDNAYGIFDAPSGPFVSLSVGRNRACAVRADRTLSCWGPGYDPSTGVEPPRMGKLDMPLSALGSVDAIEVGEGRDCGLDADGTVTCFFGGDPAKLQVPNETWSMIAAGEFQSCGLTGDGRAICWGQGPEGKPGPADERFVSVAAGSGVSCGLHADGSVACWGQDCPQNCEFSGSFSAIDAGDSLCGARTLGGIQCMQPALDVPTDTRYSAVASGWGERSFGPLNVCGLDASGRINCDNRPLPLFAGAGYPHVSVALAVVVAIDASGELVFGTGDTTLDELPTGPFVDVDLGTDYGSDSSRLNWGCAVRADGHLECFGRTFPSRLTPPEAPD